jgi:3'-phosphoadenosine 5'-phosphosulfate (PAPS) 3'-phosphatase
MPPNDLNVTQELINDIKNISIKASDQINKIYQEYKFGGKGIVLQNKEDHSALTKADLISHDIIHKALRKLTPHYSHSI